METLNINRIMNKTELHKPKSRRLARSTGLRAVLTFEQVPPSVVKVIETLAARLATDFPRKPKRNLEPGPSVSLDQAIVLEHELNSCLIRSARPESSTDRSELPV